MFLHSSLAVFPAESVADSYGYLIYVTNIPVKRVIELILPILYRRLQIMLEFDRNLSSNHRHIHKHCHEHNGNYIEMVGSHGQY